MSISGETSIDAKIISALSADDGSIRLKAALAVGVNPNPDIVDVLIARCAVESDFYVRDMLTWALIRHPQSVTIPKLLVELNSKNAQARSQALHTLSKIKNADTWSAITPSLLCDDDDEVARSAWRAAVVLVPEDQKAKLAEALSTQFGRGDREMQLSLSQAFIALGEEVINPVLKRLWYPKFRKFKHMLVRPSVS